MSNERRKFIKTGIALASAALVGGNTLPMNAYHDKQSELYTSFNANAFKNQNSIVKPPALKKGSKIAIIAPASPTSTLEIRYGKRFFQRLDIDVEVGDIVKYQDNRYRYLSAPDEIRAAELNSYLRRDDIDAILCARGGYGILRILDMVNFNAFRANPKIIIGFSDITALLIAFTQRCGVATYHGPVASSTFESFTADHVKKTLMNTENSRKVHYSLAETLVAGIARGTLTGGNLTVICSTLGTPYEIDTKGKILFIEDVSEHAYQIDRMLNQLKLAGKFRDCTGIIIGTFKSLHTRRHFFPNKGYSIKEVIDQLITPLGKPALLGFPVGHIDNQLTLPIGIRAELNTSAKTLKYLENTVN